MSALQSYACVQGWGCDPLAGLLFALGFGPGESVYCGPPQSKYGAPAGWAVLEYGECGDQAVVVCHNGKPLAGYYFANGDQWACAALPGSPLGLMACGGSNWVWQAMVPPPKGETRPGSYAYGRAHAALQQGPVY